MMPPALEVESWNLTLIGSNKITITATGTNLETLYDMYPSGLTFLIEMLKTSDDTESTLEVIWVHDIPQWVQEDHSGTAKFSSVFIFTQDVISVDKTTTFRVSSLYNGRHGGESEVFSTIVSSSVAMSNSCFAVAGLLFAWVIMY